MISIGPGHILKDPFFTELCLSIPASWSAGVAALLSFKGLQFSVLLHKTVKIVWRNNLGTQASDSGFRH